MMTIRPWLYALAFAQSLLTMTGAQAASLRGTISGAFDADFLIESGAAIDPSGVDEGQGAFQIDGSLWYADPLWRSHNAALTFYSDAVGGGLAITNEAYTGFVFNASGPQIFSGSLYAPRLAPGQWQLIDYDDPAKSYMLTFSAVEQASAVPEPGSWVLMLGGFGLVGIACRRRVRAAAVCSSA